MILRSYLCTYLSVLLFIFSLEIFSQKKLRTEPINAIIVRVLDFSIGKRLQMAELLRYQPNSPPWTTDKSGMLKTCSPDWWVSGLFAG